MQILYSNWWLAFHTVWVSTYIVITRAGFSLLERGVMMRKVTDVAFESVGIEGRT